MRKTYLFVVVFSWLNLALIGCIGPATPFGSIDEFSPIKVTREDPISDHFGSELGLKIEFKPDRQVLHRKSNFEIVVYDPMGIDPEHTLKVEYDGVDISDKFLNGSKKVIDADGSKVSYRWSRLKLPASRDNHIRFNYLDKDRRTLGNQIYKMPDCNMLSMDEIKNTKPFKPSKRTLSYLEYWGKEYSYSPSLVAGLVAQESAFNPSAVSWAKAVGLTQVTPLADMEVAKRYDGWPRSKKVRRLPASMLKTMIHLGKVSPKEDWRLDPERSIQGGYEYLRYLHGYWHKSQNARVFSSIYGQSPERLTEIILASYNSGAYRVKSALKSYGQNYLLSGSLKEAKKYVSKVSSYCYHFSQPLLKEEQ